MHFLLVGAVVAGFLLVLYSVFWYLRFYYYRHVKGFPPGPYGLPFVGYLPFLQKKIYKTAEDLRFKYGDIISIPLGNKMLVFVTGYDSIKACLIGEKEAFAGRPTGHLNQKLVNPNNLGIAMQHGANWEILRRFSLRVLKDFGLGRSTGEDLVLQEVQTIAESFDAAGGGDFDPTYIIGRSVSSVTCALIFGYRAGHEDPKFDELLKAASDALQSGPEFSLLNELVYRFPALMSVIPKWMMPILQRAEKIMKIHSYNMNKIKERKDNFDAESEPRDYMDAFLKERYVRSHSNPSEKEEIFTDEQLTRTLMDLFIAGSDTTATTLKWSLLLMSLYPDVQDKVYKELVEVVGLGKDPCMKDKTRTPYTEAVIHEVMRFRSIAPITLPHTTTRKVQVMGFTIPQNTLVFGSIYSCHMDTKSWRNALSFDPNNFLDAQGNMVVSDHFIPFSLGKRSCLGEALAKTELYVFFASIFLHYRVIFGDKQTKPTEEILAGSLGGGVHAPLDYKIKVERRVA